MTKTSEWYNNIADLLEYLIYYVRKDKLSKLSICHKIAEDDYILYVESMIGRLRDDNKGG